MPLVIFYTYIIAVIKVVFLKLFIIQYSLMEWQGAPRFGVESRCKASMKPRESCFGCALLSHRISRWLLWTLRGAFSLMGKKPKSCYARSWAAMQWGQHSGVCARALQCGSAALRWGLMAGQPCQTLAEKAVNLFVMLIVQDPHPFSTPASLLKKLKMWLCPLRLIIMSIFAIQQTYGPLLLPLALSDFYCVCLCK